MQMIGLDTSLFWQLFVWIKKISMQLTVCAEEISRTKTAKRLKVMIEVRYI